MLQGDYDLVITDYTRVKSLFGDTEIKVFKKGECQRMVQFMVEGFSGVRTVNSVKCIFH